MFKICQVCFCLSTPENPLTFAADQYMAEIKNDETKVWECANCRHESLMDI